MNKPILMIPGPVDPPDEVMKRCGGAVFPHYEEEFSLFYRNLIAKMKNIFGTSSGSVHVANGSGTMAINMILSSLCTPEDSVLVINNGDFGAYGEKHLRCIGVPYVSMTGERGFAADPEQVRQVMKQKRCPFIYVTYNESSTAVLNRLPALGEIAREFDALLLVDGISALGGIAIDMDETGADAVAGASQKCLELPPGLAPVAVSRRAIDHMKSKKNRRVPYVLDLLIWEDAMERMGDWHPQPITGATSLLYALDWMADRIGEEGVKCREKRFAAAGMRLKNGFAELGFQSVVPPDDASPVVSEFIVPAGVTADDIRAYYLKVHNTMVGRGWRRDRDGRSASFRIANFGQAADAGRIDFMIDITGEFIRKRFAGSIRQKEKTA